MTSSDTKRQPLPPGESIFDKKDPHPEHAVEPDPEQEKLKKELDKSLKDSFPASDPPSVSQPTVATGEKTRTAPQHQKDNRTGNRNS
jgi:hypothetical protein